MVKTLKHECTICNRQQSQLTSQTYTYYSPDVQSQITNTKYKYVVDIKNFNISFN